MRKALTALGMLLVMAGPVAAHHHGDKQAHGSKAEKAAAADPNFNKEGVWLIGNLSFSSDWRNNARVGGYVQNNTPYPMRSVDLEVTLYDAGGVLCDFFTVHTEAIPVDGCWWFKTVRAGQGDACRVTARIGERDADTSVAPIKAPYPWELRAKAAAAVAAAEWKAWAGDETAVAAAPAGK